MPISKTDFIRGLQCPKMLWLDSHMPHLRVIPPQVQLRLDQGNEFGDNAMSVFGEYRETTAFKPDGKLNFSKMLETTALLLATGENVICEACFSWYGNFCAVDILKKNGVGYDIYEVKNSTLIKKEFLLDLSFQRLILRKNGILLQNAYLILNGTEKEKREGQGCVERIEKDGLIFEIHDVSRETKLLERSAEKRIFELGKIKMKAAPTPNVRIGEQCDSPYRCWYYEYCHGAEK